jgi:hypothetical protein
MSLFSEWVRKPMTFEQNPPSVRTDGLQLAEHRSFQERFWKIERFAWLTFGLIVVVALLGFTGSGGMLASRNIDTQTGHVTMPRVTRWLTADDFTVRLSPSTEESRSIFLGEDFIKRFAIDGIQPQPESVTLASDGVRFRFTTEPGQTGPVIFQIRAQHIGLMTSSIATDDGETIKFQLLTLP